MIIEDEKRSVIQNYLHEKSESIFNMSTLVTTPSLTHQWTIEKFSEVCEVKKHGTPLLVSSIFSVDEFQAKFHLALLPNKNEGDGCSDYMSLFLRCDNPPEGETFLQGKAFLVNSKGEKIFVKCLYTFLCFLMC